MLKLFFIFFTVSCCILNLKAATVGVETKLSKNDYTLVNDIKLYFKESLIARSFSDAVLNCRAEGASMFASKSKAEMDALLKFAKKSPLWLGIHDNFSEGVFVTMDGESIEKTYSNWRAGEPNNVNGNENCVIMASDGGYVDVNCDALYNYVCVKNTTNIQMYDICETYDTEYEYLLLTNRCYKLHKTPRNWKDAYGICKAENSDLAIINDEHEATFLTEMFNKNPITNMGADFDMNYVYLGFSDILISGLFLTSDGKTLNDAGYDEWSLEYEKNAAGKRCGIMDPYGKLKDVNCDRKALFICEKKLKDSAPKIDARNSN